MQRGLKAYGLAQKCKTSWPCSADGVTPEPHFEDTALAEMCAEPGCHRGVVAALHRSWMGQMGGDVVATMCDRPTSVAAGTAQALMYSREDKGDWTEKKCKDKFCKDDDTASDFCDEQKDNTSHVCYDHCCDWDRCFPGHALATSESGDVPVGSLRKGVPVLVELPGGSLGFEPVLGFLHARWGSESNVHVEVGHETGVLRASPGHIVFAREGAGRVDRTAAELKVGDELFAAPKSGTLPRMSRVLWIRRGQARAGMYAPYTASGTIVVDGVVASNYAWPSPSIRLPHWLAHAAVGPLRLYHRLGLSKLFGGATIKESCDGESDVKHPYLAVLHENLGLDRLLPLLPLS